MKNKETRGGRQESWVGGGEMKDLQWTLGVVSAELASELSFGGWFWLDRNITIFCTVEDQGNRGGCKREAIKPLWTFYS